MEGCGWLSSGEYLGVMSMAQQVAADGPAKTQTVVETCNCPTTNLAT